MSERQRARSREPVKGTFTGSPGTARAETDA